jgi:quercetin dioxygenase-like cupin family protein
MKTHWPGTILARDEGRFARGTVGNLRIKIGAAESGGALSLVEYQILPGGRTVPHYHLKIYESVFISEGELRVRVGDEWTIQAAGTTILLPVGVVHAWENSGTEPARMLIISTPAVDGFFEEMGTLVENAPDGKPGLEQLRELNQKYDFVLVDE